MRPAESGTLPIGGGSVSADPPLRDGDTVRPTTVVADGTRRWKPAPGAALGIAGVLTFILLWELVVRLGLVSSAYLPAFTQTLSSLTDLLTTASFWSQIGATARGWALGLGIASALGIALGILIGSVPALTALTKTTIEFLRPVPSVALVPLVVIMFGTGPESTLVLVVYAAFWQMLVQVIYGVHDVDPVAKETAQSFRLGTWRTVRNVVWPTALPYAMTGFRLAAAVALILEITGELIIGSPGIGKAISLAQTAGDAQRMYALVIVAGLAGVAVNVGVRLLEKRVLRWHPSVRKGTEA
ncbi:ABC transporter permease [Rhodococcus qingshengii]|uniref:ABC transporter permease n=1 Tax=Rhodococcus qingshengii TaxID=334542 RepID=UPI0022B2EA7F|nr:ABC transporter permease [Rhodococcus qingshengii]MCZ4618612.1 ABC transporter permease [Rhodococcus qingshengii]